MMNSGKIVLKDLMMDFKKIHHLKNRAIRFFALYAFILVLSDLNADVIFKPCLLYTSPSPRDA